MKCILLVLIATATTLPPAKAHAWGPAGHRIVAALAERNLNAKAKAAIRRLLGPDVALADIANFADNPYREEHPETYNWHFVDIPFDDSTYQPSRDCKVDPKSGDCVIAALEREVAILADSKRPDDERLLALKLVVHFVGDEHQPLHAENHDDKGGNSLKVKWFGKPSSLHKVWDSGIINETGLSEPGYVGQLSTFFTKKEKKVVQQGMFTDWALEAHMAAQKVAYGPELKNAGGKPPELEDDYFQVALPVVDKQLARAGLRLAETLNRALGGLKATEMVAADSHRPH